MDVYTRVYGCTHVLIGVYICAWMHILVHGWIWCTDCVYIYEYIRVCVDAHTSVYMDIFECMCFNNVHVCTWIEMRFCVTSLEEPCSTTSGVRQWMVKWLPMHYCHTLDTLKWRENLLLCNIFHWLVKLRSFSDFSPYFPLYITSNSYWDIRLSKSYFWAIQTIVNR